MRHKKVFRNNTRSICWIVMDKNKILTFMQSLFFKKLSTIGCEEYYSINGKGGEQIFIKYLKIINGSAF